MKKITDTRLGFIHYPVGEYIHLNLSTILSYADIIKKRCEGIPVNLFCTGSSGAIISGIIATEIPVTIYHVKKEGEHSHNFTAPKPKDGFNVIVDDFIASGNTIKYILGKYVEIVKKFDLLIVSQTVCKTDLVEFNKIVPIKSVVAQKFDS